MKFSRCQMWKLPQFVWVCLRMCLCVSFCSNCLYFSSNLWIERGNGLFLDCLCCEWSDKATGITAVRQGFRIKYWVWPNLENTLKGKKCLHFDTSHHYIVCAVVGLFFVGVGGVVRGQGSLCHMQARSGRMVCLLIQIERVISNWQHIFKSKNSEHVLACLLNNSHFCIY